MTPTFTGELWLASDRLHQDGGCLVDLQPHHPLRPHRHPHLHGHPQAVSWNMKHHVPDILLLLILFLPFDLHHCYCYCHCYYFHLLTTIKGETRRKRKRRVSLRLTVWECFFLLILVFFTQNAVWESSPDFRHIGRSYARCPNRFTPNEPTLKLLLILSAHW